MILQTFSAPEPGAVTAGLAELLAQAGIVLSYDESPKWLQAYLLFSVSENTVRSETEKMGMLQEDEEEKLIEKSQSAFSNGSILNLKSEIPGSPLSKFNGR